MQPLLPLLSQLFVGGVKMIKVGDLVRYKISEIRSYHTDDKIALAQGKVPLLVVYAKKRQRRKQPVYFYKVLHPDGSIASARSSDITKRL
mgnify:CR=1 FL=1